MKFGIGALNDAISASLMFFAPELHVFFADVRLNDFPQVYGLYSL